MSQVVVIIKKYTIVGIVVSILATFLFHFGDIPIAYFFRDGVSTEVHEFAELLTDAGDSVWTLVPSLILWLGLWKIRREDARRAMLMFLSVAGSGLVGIVIKILVCRARPPLLFDKGIYGFAPFTFATDFLHNSFPSGHAATAMSAVTVLAELFPSVRIPLYCLGILVCATRVILGVHYASDILVGGALGWLTTDILYNRFFNTRTSTPG